MAKKNSVKNNYSIELLKFLFSLVIINLHYFHINYFDSAKEADSFYFAKGALAVEFFFLVSCYFMAQNAMKNTSIDVGLATKDYMKRKINTFFPTILISWVFIFPLLQYIEKVSLHQFFDNLFNSYADILLLRSGGFRGYYSIPVTWYISAMLIVMLLMVH